MRDHSLLNWYQVTNMECFPLLWLIWRSTSHPRHRFSPLGLVLTLGPSLGGEPGHRYGPSSPMRPFLQAPWRVRSRFKARSLGLCSRPVDCFYFRYHQLPTSPLPKRAWARAEFFLELSGELHVARQGLLDWAYRRQLYCGNDG